jgi:sugar phosphate isomerase/epimerase
MTQTRRNFIKTAALGTAGAAGTLGLSVNPSLSEAYNIPGPKQPAILKLSCQEGIAPGESLAEKLDFIEANGYVGLEVGGKGLPGRVTEFQKALSGRKIKMSAICAGFDGVLISEKEEVRRQAVASMKEILTAAGALGSTGLIIVPAFNTQTTLGNREAREILIPLLAELGEHAVSVKSRILLEPLNRKEAFFLRLVADAAAMCRDSASPGICCMADFWHMTWEETSDMGAIISGGSYLHHIHIASRKNRKMPGEDAGDNYVDGLRALKLLGYRDYVSLECGSVGDKKVTIPAAAKLIKDQWALA